MRFNLPGALLAGQYALTAWLAMNGGTGRVLAGAYTVPPFLVSLGIGPAPVWSTNGLSLVLQGPLGSNYLVQVSSDLVRWAPSQYFAITNSPFYFSDQTATNAAQRFYRAVMP